MLIPGHHHDDKNNGDDLDAGDDHEHRVDLACDKSQLRECNRSRVITSGRGVEVH